MKTSTKIHTIIILIVTILTITIATSKILKVINDRKMARRLRAKFRNWDE